MTVAPKIWDLTSLPKLGVDLADLVTVMLEFGDNPVVDCLDRSWAYKSSKPELAHVNGIQTRLHTTLRHGLLPGVDTSDIAEVLHDWCKPRLIIDKFDVFPSQVDGEPYTCIYGSTRMPVRGLVEAHERLGMLPHVNTHPQYMPHVTLAYVKRRYEAEALRALDVCNFPLIGRHIKVSRAFKELTE